MLRFTLPFAVAAFLAGSAHACSCMRTTLTEFFNNDSYETIGVFCDAVASRPFPDIVNQGDPIEWTLRVKEIYKGNCSLASADSHAEVSTISVKSGANSALCGVGLGDRCSVLGITKGGYVNSCGPIYDFENLSASISAELEANNKCSSDCI